MDMKTKQQAYEDERAKNETNEEIETSLLLSHFRAHDDAWNVASMNEAHTS